MVEILAVESAGDLRHTTQVRRACMRAFVRACARAGVCMCPRAEEVEEVEEMRGDERSGLPSPPAHHPSTRRCQDLLPYSVLAFAVFVIPSVVNK